jgi:hypothetical protein
LTCGLEHLPVGGQKAAVALQARCAVRAGLLACEMHRPHRDLAEPGGDRTDARLDALGQAAADFGQTLADLLAREINVGAFGEHGGDLREAVARQRARAFQAGRAGQRGLDREGDLLLDFDRRQRGRDGVDLNLLVGDVGHRVDRQPGQPIDAEHGGDGAEGDDNPAAIDGKIDDRSNHVSARPRLRPFPARPSA